MSKEITLNEAKGALNLAKDYKAITGQAIDDDIIDVLEYAVETMTPPTADEVCKALSECLRLDKFISKCIFDDKKFYGKIVMTGYIRNNS